MLPSNTIYLDVKLSAQIHVSGKKDLTFGTFFWRFMVCLTVLNFCIAIPSMWIPCGAPGLEYECMISYCPEFNNKIITATISQHLMVRLQIYLNTDKETANKNRNTDTETDNKTYKRIHICPYRLPQNFTST